MILFAHRGASGRVQENTIEAFELALELGATGLESDVWITSDGIAVLDHDGEVDGRAVATLSRGELPSWIPTIDDLFELCAADTHVSLDLKDDAALAAVLAAARRHGIGTRLWVCHHRWRRLGGWRDEAAEVRLVDSTYVGFMSGGPAQRAERLVTAGIDAVNLHHSEWTPELHATFAEVGLATFAWDAQDDAVVRRMMELGIDAVFSDHVDVMVAASGRGSDGEEVDVTTFERRDERSH